MLDLNFNPFPTIETERLILRQLDIADAADLYVVRTHPIVLRYTNMAVHQNAADTEAFIEQILANEANGKAIMWAIALKSDPDLIIGTICYWNIEPENDKAEIGYILHPDHHRKGLMNEALARVITYGFDTMKLHSIIADLDPANIATVKLLEKNGFTLETHFEKNFLRDDELEDTAVYILKIK